MHWNFEGNCHPSKNILPPQLLCFLIFFRASNASSVWNSMHQKSLFQFQSIVEHVLVSPPTYSVFCSILQNYKLYLTNLEYWCQPCRDKIGNQIFFWMLRVIDISQCWDPRIIEQKNLDQTCLVVRVNHHFIIYSLETHLNPLNPNFVNLKMNFWMLITFWYGSLMINSIKIELFRTMFH